MSKLLINPSAGGTSDYYGTFAAFNNAYTGNVIYGLNVVQAASPNMTVVVNPGVGIIRDGSNPGQIGYHAVLDTSGGQSVTIATANSSNPRIDYIVGYVDKSATPSGTNNTNVYKIISVAGTPAATPAVPTVSQIQTAIGSASNPYDIYAQIAVAKSATSITTSNITDKRTMAQPNLVAGQVGTTQLAAASVTADKIDFTTSGAVWWQEIGRTVLGSNGSTLTISSLPAKRYLRVLFNIGATGGTAVANIRFNGDSGSNYNFRYYVSGAAGTSNSASSWGNLETTSDSVNGIIDIINPTTGKKTGHVEAVSIPASASASVLSAEFWGVWHNNTASISSITFTNTGTGSFASGSGAIVLGHD